MTLFDIMSLISAIWGLEIEKKRKNKKTSQPNLTAKNVWEIQNFGETTADMTEERVEEGFERSRQDNLKCDLRYCWPLHM